MHWIDWLIIAVPLVFVVGIALYSHRYANGVAGFLAAGRVARRYVLTTGNLVADVSLLTLVASVEIKYYTGCALAFWEAITIPLGAILGLSGFFIYRFRETRALSGGQFLELRYNRPLRIIASFIRVTAEAMTNSVGPAVAAKFFIYFFDLPHSVAIAGVNVPTFALLVFFILVTALALILPGGRIALMVTDSIQAILSYPIFIILTFFILKHFSWSGEIAPVLNNRVAGESFLNAFDIQNLKDFNIVMIIIMMIYRVYGSGCWCGNDIGCAAKDPHEQKMAGILNNWRFGFSTLMLLVLSLSVITLMTHPNFSSEGRTVRTTLAAKVMEQVDPGNAAGAAQLRQKIAALPDVQSHAMEKPLSRDSNVDTPYLKAAGEVFGTTPDGVYKTRQFKTLFMQMMMPVSMRNMLPAGLMGIFGLLCVMLMVTTDDSRIFNSAAAFTQDLIIPFCSKPLTPEAHVKLLRWVSVGVALFFFICTLFFSQLEYINMFITILAGLWTGGACPIMIFGMYSRFGNTTGAFCSLIFGSGTSLAGVLIQTNWAKHVYPFLTEHGWAEGVGSFLLAVSKPLNPYVVWQITPEKFPVNSYEILFLAMFFGTIAYVIGSLVTYKAPYNLDRLLHRGEYAPADKKIEPMPRTFSAILGKLVGINSEYALRDKILAWSVFGYSVVWQFGLCFVLVLVWNLISPWPNSWWSVYFYIVNILVAIVIGLISSVWFFCGGLHDIVWLFRDLAKRVDNPLDNGQVQGNVSLVDLADEQQKKK